MLIQKQIAIRYPRKMKSKDYIYRLSNLPSQRRLHLHLTEFVHLKSMVIS